MQTIPHCGTQTKRIYDYRYQEIKVLPFQMKHTNLVLKKRRYVYKCGKRFTEKYHFLPTYQRRTLRLSFKIIDQLRNLVSINLWQKPPIYRQVLLAYFWTPKIYYSFSSRVFIY
ncbi:transposase family protein [Anaerocolumna aminovalerica]|uniref:transposase family protein n=1 Tax=Anaerocolumna aminovalerica TaxID=1527 RepID=UPI00209DF923|nr:transposase family protein [Anaerocolumna aminovalerica]